MASATASAPLATQGALVLATRARGDARELCGDLLDSDVDLDVDFEELDAAERWLLPYHETEADLEDADEYAAFHQGWGHSHWLPPRLGEHSNHTSGEQLSDSRRLLLKHFDGKSHVFIHKNSFN